MLLTDKVSMEWLSSQNMTRGLMTVGVPVDLNDLSKGLNWKNMFTLTTEDYDIIDKYYELKQRNEP